jgi:uncharacterized membrane-anchored protein YhcB (DUF1043 family)
MNEKGNNIVVIFISLIVAILLGYVVMYIKTPTVKEEPEENKVVEDIKPEVTITEKENKQTNKELL